MAPGRSAPPRAFGSAANATARQRHGRWLRGNASALRTACAASTPATAAEFTISPASTWRTASASGTHRSCSSASSSSGCSGRGTSLSALGEVHPDGLVGQARRGQHVDQHRPVAGGQPGLLGQLAGRRRRRVLPRDVQQAGGQLPEPVAHRGAGTAGSSPPGPASSSADDRHRPEMLDGLANRHPPAGHHDLVDAQRHHLADVDRPGLGHVEGVNAALGRQKSRTRHRDAPAGAMSRCGARSPSARSSSTGSRSAAR